MDGTERKWNQLLALIEERQVIPVVGPELLTLPDQDRSVLLYRRVAEQLLRDNGMRAAGEDAAPAAGEIVLRRNLELNDAVSELGRQGLRTQDLYAEIKALILRSLGADPPIPEALSQLAGIPAFDLFVTTTSDDLLRRALAMRWGGVDEIVFAPNLPAHEVRDIPEHRNSGYRAVFYMFGRASALPIFAIHEEDRLEFFYTLQTAQKNVPRVMLSELRARNLLVIGCALSEWLARFFIRFTSKSRLADGMRKRDFLIDPQIDQERGFAVFLERFSQNTHVFAQTGPAFVRELERRWRQLHPDDSAYLATAQETGTPEAAVAPDIFISYSRTDLAAAKVLYEDLKQRGFGVAWFDKSVLRPGDAWEDSVKSAIQTCKFFLPLLSASTEQRAEGFFRSEWKAAATRSDRIQGEPFLFPVVIDPVFDGKANRYQRVPPQFHAAQFGHAPGGQMSDELRQALTLALRERRRPAVP